MKTSLGVAMVSHRDSLLLTGFILGGGALLVGLGAATTLPHLPWPDELLHLRPLLLTSANPDQAIQPASSLHQRPVLAVIPTVLLSGPLAVLALLFPVVFGGLTLFLRRWLAVLAVLSVNSTLYLLHAWFYPSIRAQWWGSPKALGALLALVTVGGLVWAVRRQGAASRSGPGRGELVVLELLTTAGLGLVAYELLGGQPLFSPCRRLLLALWAGTAAATVHILLWRAGKPARSTEGVMLGAMALTGVGMTVAGWLAGTRVEVAWVFDAPGQGKIFSSPVVVGDRIYVAAAHEGAFSFPGAVYCLDQQTGEKLWAFEDGGRMKQVFSSPCVADGRLYIGEGFHQDSCCKLYCLDAATGQKLWDFQTRGHTESTPQVADGRVFFGAGDDGLYCLDARTGKAIWHFEGPHVDAQPAVTGDRVYAGSGYSTYEVFCLDAATGKPVWRMPVELPAFGSPTVSGEYVLFGLGNGNFLNSAETPSGALLCLETRTGKTVWRYSVADAVHTKPLVAGEDVYFTSRDCCCYCLDRTYGQLRWRQNLRSPIVTTPVLADDPHTGEKSSLYVVASDGLVCCLDPRTGLPRWAFDVAEHAQAQHLLLSSPATVIDQSQQREQRRLYFGAGLRYFVSTPRLYSLVEDFSD